MVVVVTLQASPAAGTVDEPMAFSGSVLDDDVPVTGLWVTVLTVQGGVLLAGVETDGSGHYYVEWVPDASWTGTFDVRTYAAYGAGYYSSPVTLIVSGGGNVQVRFFVYDEVNSTPLMNVEVTLDGVVLYTDNSGLAVYEGVTQGNHSYSVYAEDYNLSVGYDMLDRPLELTGMFVIEWSDGSPWPEENSWTNVFQLTPVDGVTPPPPVEFPWVMAGFLVMGAGLLLFGTKKGSRILTG